MKQKCTISGCQNNHYALGFCRKHHARFIRKGTAEPTYNLSGYDPLDGVKDTRPGHRGNYAVNVINDIKAKARRRKKTWALTHRQAFDLIRSKCHYCGFEPKWPEERVGIDRMDNDVGYVYENCAPCCFTCNTAKGTLGKEKFRQWICRIYENFKDK